MFVDTSKLHRNGKTCVRHLLRSSWRENGKVKHRTHANLSHCSPEEIAAIKLAEKLRIASRVVFSEGDREIRLEKREQEVAEIVRLDDCHALKTDLGREVADKDLVHRRYKDLAPVETAFRDRGMPRPFPNHA